ncbi:MAG TPA: oligosaccharide flippase family protein [Geobacterales bacterium]|nr:oligosaccharide flippase family protein [Geobacterales bacterium]
MEITEVGSSYARGATYVFAGRVLSYVFNFIGSFLLARLIALKYGSAEPLGILFVLSFVPQLTLLLYDFGIGYGVTNKAPRLIKEGKIEEASEYIYSSIVFTLPLWIFYATFTYFIGDWLAVNLYSRPEIIPYIHIIAIYIIIGYVNSIASGAPIITDKTWVFSSMLLLNSAIQGLVAPFLFIIGYDLYGVVFAYYVLAPLLSSIPGLVIFFQYFKVRKVDLAKTKSMLKFGFPLAAANYLGIPSARVYEVFMSRFASATALGNFSIAARFSPFIDIFTYPIYSLIFPNYSKLRNGGDLKLALNFTIKILSYFVAPVSIFLMFFPEQAIIAIFGPYYKDAWIYLLLNAIYWLTSCLGGWAISNLIATQGYSKEVFKFTAVYVALNLALNVSLIPLFSIIGAQIATLLAGWPSYFLSLKYLKQKMNISINFREIGKVVLISLIAILPSFILWNILARFIILAQLSFYGLFGFCILLSLVLYVIATKRFGVLKDSEIDFIKRSLRPVPLVGNFISVILDFYKRL